VTDDGDRGLAASPEFLAYQERLRSTWPANHELAVKHGVLAETEHSYDIDMSESQSGETGAQLYETTLGRRRMMQATGVALATAATAGSAAAASDDDLTLNYETDYVANPYIAADVTIGQHKSDYTSPLMYENDNGEDVELPAVIDETDPNDSDKTTQNLYGIRADRVDAGAYHAFPRDAKYDEDGDGDEDTAVKAVDATHWSTDESNTSGSLSVSDGSDEVSSVSLAASSIASGETATATFDLTAHNASITSDEDKRYLQLAFNVDALTSGAVVSVRAVDEDGDYKEATIDPSGDTSNTGVMANATGSGYVAQIQLADLSVQGSGDGTFNNIESLEVQFAEADATVELFGIDLERKSKWEYGEFVQNEHTDDEETTTIYEPGPGYQKLTDLSGSVLQNANIYDLEVPVKYTAGESDEGGSSSSTQAENYPSFDKKLKQIERLATETAIDLSHSNMALKIDQSLPTSRYHTLELATGTSDIDDPEDMTWTDVSGSLSGAGTTSTLEDMIEAGKQYTLRVRTVLTQSEFNDATSSGGGGFGGARTSGGGGLLSGVQGMVLALVAAGAGYFGFVRQRLPW